MVGRSILPLRVPLGLRTLRSGGVPARREHAWSDRLRPLVGSADCGLARGKPVPGLDWRGSRKPWLSIRSTLPASVPPGRGRAASGSAEFGGRRSGGSRWLSAPVPQAAGAACRRPAHRPRRAERGALIQNRRIRQQWGRGHGAGETRRRCAEEVPRAARLRRRPQSRPGLAASWTRLSSDHHELTKRGNPSC